MREKRSIVSFGEVSSSMTSWTFRPAMPPSALIFSIAHSVARIPLMPGLAARPVRGARTPIFSGLFCAIAGAKRPEAGVTSAPAAAADFNRLRRVMFMVSSRLFYSVRPSFGSHDILRACQQTSYFCRPPPFFIFRCRQLPGRSHHWRFPSHCRDWPRRPS